MRKNLSDMYQVLKRGKNLILLFACGFLIGVFLEIILIGTGEPAIITKLEPLGQSVKVSCLILLKHKHLRYITTSKKTWLKHCDYYYIVDIQTRQKFRKHLFKASSEEEALKSSTTNNSCKKDKLKNIVVPSAWSGLCKAIQITKPSQSHWLIIVPDSVIVLVENLRLFVKDLNCDDGHYFGYGLNHHEADYNVMSAGVLLSRGAVKKLLDVFTDEESCESSGKFWRNEDFYLGKNLKKLGILPKDTRDKEGRGRFHGYNLNNVLWPGKLFNQSDYKRKALYPVSKGFGCCSPHLITLDVSDPDATYSLYYFLYNLKITHKTPLPPANVTTNKDFFWKDFLRQEGYNETAIENMSSEEYYNIWNKKLPLDAMYKEMKNFIKNHKKDA